MKKWPYRNTISLVAINLILGAAVGAQLQAGIWDAVKSAFIAPEKPQSPKIKILIAHNLPYANIEVNGKYEIYDPYKNVRLSARFTGKRQKIEALSTGLRWGEEFPGVYQIEIVPDNESISVKIDGKEYSGIIYVYDIGGSISIVNEVDIEHYLSATLPDQLSSDLSDEALSAAVIATRTNAYYKATASTNPYWHLNAEQVGYQGRKKNQSLGAFAVHEAIASTRFMVLSETGAYEGVLTPFPINLIAEADVPSTKGSYTISVDKLQNSAEKGDNAAQILSKTFPQAKIELNHKPDVVRPDVRLAPQNRSPR